MGGKEVERRDRGARGDESRIDRNDTLLYIVFSNSIASMYTPAAAAAFVSVRG